MNRLSVSTVRQLVDSALEYLSIRSPSTTETIDSPLSDPRARLSSTRLESEAQFRPKSVQTDEVGVAGGIAGREELQSRSTVELESSSREIARLRAELKHLQDKHRTLQLILQGTQSQVIQKDVTIQLLRQRNDSLEKDFKDSQSLAEERRVEVKSLEQFLSKTDSWAGSDMVQSIKDMNNEILQFSAAASEQFADIEELVENPAREKSLEKVGKRFGALMRQSLKERDHTSDPSLLQYALQSCICMHISHALSSFCFGLPGRFDSQLSKIHRHMHETELQPTSARWRALTHRHIYELTPNIGKTAVNDVVDSIMRGVANILTAAGLGEVDDHIAALQSDFDPNLRRIATSASRVSRVIRECTVSTEFQAIYVEPAKEFNAITMDNLYEGYGEVTGRVLCTTEIGLQCFTNTRKDETDSNFIERRLVLKPKIILESVLQLLDEE